jgi:hypothetical protein
MLGVESTTYEEGMNDNIKYLHEECSLLEDRSEPKSPDRLTWHKRRSQRHLSTLSSWCQRLNRTFSQGLPTKIDLKNHSSCLYLANVVSKIETDLSKPHLDLRVSGVQFDIVAVHIFSRNLKF